MTASVLNLADSDDAIVDRAADYRRQARRLRHTLRREPVKLHRSLKYLSACHDIATRPSRASAAPAQVQRAHFPPAPEYVIDQTSTTIRDFADAVVKSMRGPILSYSQRQVLMRKAKQIGLRSFDANLIIAAVQNRVKEAITPEPTKPMSWRFAIVLGAVVQVGIIASIWWMLHV